MNYINTVTQECPVTREQIGALFPNVSFAAADWPPYPFAVAPPPEPGPLTEADYDEAMEDLFAAKAKERRYDSKVTCALRAGYPGPFQAEGIAFASWMDACNAHAYQVMAAVLGGQRAQPTIAELLAEFPSLVWP